MAIETTSDLSSVVSSQIVDGAVTSAKIADNAVVAAKIAAGAVGSAALASGAVVAASIAAAAVGTAAISSGSATSGQILQANGSGAVTFATPAAGGGLTLIATGTPSAATSVSFTSIPTTYKHLLVRWFGVYMNITNGYFNLRVNSDTGSNYAWHYTRFMGGASSAGRSNPSATSFGANDDNAAVIVRTSDSSTTYDRHGSGSLVIYDYASTSLRRNLQSLSWGDNGGNVVLAHNDGYYTPTGTAITSIEFVRQQGTETINGTFYLYGVS